RGGSRAWRADRASARRHCRCRNARHFRERCDGRYYRLGRPRGAAHGAILGRPGLRAAHSGSGAPRRWLPPGDRHGGAHGCRGRNPARHSHCRGGYAVFHLATYQRVADLVMKLAGHGLSIGYSDRLVGHDLDVALETGEVLALLGPNGSGKTTLLKTLLGLLAPKAGDVHLDGRALSTYASRDRARLIAYVPQSHQATFAFTVETVVLMGRIAHGNLFSRPTAADRVVAARSLERFGIAHLRERPYTMISGGERQLALLARALAQEPQFIVLDEPTASLDFGNQGK